jgi:hypothetical protein
MEVAAVERLESDASVERRDGDAAVERFGEVRQ